MSKRDFSKVNHAEGEEKEQETEEAAAAARAKAKAEELRLETDANGQWLRRFMTPRVYDGEYRMDGKMNWTRFWSTRKLPQSEAEVPAFVILMADRHARTHYGSYELQLLLHTINSSRRHSGLAAAVLRLLPASGLDEVMQRLITESLEHFTQYVDLNFADSSCVKLEEGETCLECAATRRWAKLRYHSFRHKN